MSNQKIEALTVRSNEIQARYQFAFAGKPRATRRLEDLETIIRDADSVVKDARFVTGAEDIRKTAEDRLEMYKNERGAIMDAQKGGPGVPRVATLGVRANQYSNVYQRHFAGQNRLTRDLGLLDEIIDSLREIQGEFRELINTVPNPTEDFLRVVERNIELYVTEREAIEAARSVAQPEDLTSTWANLANGQFAVYRTHFAGRARNSRRLSLLRRVVATLELCRDGMNALVAAASDVETNGKNVGIVNERLSAYKAELGEIQKAREALSVFETIDALGAAANEVMAEYREHFAGKDRVSRDLDLLVGLCDRMLEIERQMWDLKRAIENPTNDRNVGIVQDALAMYHAEFNEIRKAKGLIPAGN